MANEHGSIDGLLRQALDLQRRGRLKQAQQLYRDVLQRDTANFDALQLLGLCHYQDDQPALALQCLDAALALRRDVASVFNHRGIVLRALQRPAEALADFDAAIALTPDHADALYNKGNALVTMGDHPSALPLFQRAVALQPRNAKYLNNLASCWSELDNQAKALACYQRVLEIDPASVTGLINIGLTRHKLGQFEEALSAFSRAAELDPTSVEAHGGLGDCLRALDRLPEALTCCEAAIRLNARSAESHCSRGNVLQDLARHDEALASYDRAISLKPDYAEAHTNRAAVLTKLNRNDEALQDFERCFRILARGDKRAEVVAEQCTKLLSIDRIPAIYESEAALAATRARVDRVLDQLVEICDTDTVRGAAEIRVARQAMSSLTGFYLAYHQRNDRETMRKLSLVSQRLLSIPQHGPRLQPRQGGRIRFGIASGFLRDHNGANWAYHWLAQLPRGDYDFFTYGFEAPRDSLALRFAELGSHRRFSWVVGNQLAIIEQMRNDRLDILMLPDVGMTSESRYLSLHRIAPCQFTAWGHPVTTGSSMMDFYLSSDLMEPPDGQDHYTEQLIRLPNLALHIEERDEAEQPFPAAAYGLPEGRVLYGCLQSLFKYLPRHDEILPRIALEVPEAVFVFLEGMPSYSTRVMQNRLERAFAAHGLDAGHHVVFLPRMPSVEFDRLMRAMDVCIDSVGWSGGNTSIKNIRFGVPLATLEGNLMRGRHTSGAFRMIGADDMICRSAEDYVAMLVRLGREKDFRRQCSDLFLANRHRLYRDKTFIAALDGFVKTQARVAREV